MLSVQQPQKDQPQEIGMSSTDLPESPPKTETPGEAALREGLELEEGLRRIGKMSGIKSNHRNMQMEDRLVAQDAEIHQRDLWGDDVVNASKSNPSGEEMEVMAARDVTVNHQYPAPQPAAQPSPQPQGMSGLQQALVAGSIALGAGGLGYGLANHGNEPVVNPPAIVQESDAYDLGLLPPDKPNSNESQ